MTAGNTFIKHFTIGIVVIVTLSVSVLAHEVRPAFLQLSETAPGTFDVLWKVPGAGEDLRFGIYAELPQNCAQLSRPRSVYAARSVTERWSVACEGGLDNGTIHIVGLSATVTDVLVRIERLGGTSMSTRLTSSNPSFVVEAAPNATQVAVTYLKLGIEHILGGIDHLLFVLALLLLVRGFKRIVATITAFTVAHSVTLGAATLGFVDVPQKPVEAVIALSIAFVASEILRVGPDGSENRSLSARWPWMVAFVFGTLHGFGFAGALTEVGLPQTAIPLALLFFNIGVELGQLSFIAAAYLVFAAGRWFWKRGISPKYVISGSKGIQRLPAYAIGAVAMFWVIERLAAF